MTHRQLRIVVGIILLVGVLCGVVLGGFVALTQDLPQIRSLETYAPSAVTQVFSADGHLLAEFYREKRNPVPLAEIPGYLKTAIITTEDRKFYRHSGIDVRGIVRALVRDIRVGKFVEGASTITQQLAKTLFLTPRKTFIRKLKEMFLAFQLERRYTKEEILELYLNQVYFGSGAYGVASAAKRFFGKPVSELTLAENALVAGMPQAPSRYSPLVNPDLALQRRNSILKQMRQTGSVSEADYQSALAEPLVLAGGADAAVRAPYFIAYIRTILEDAVGSSLLYRGGLEVRTTLSWDLQQAAEAAVASGLADLQDRMRGRGGDHPSPQAALVCLGVDSGEILAMVGGKDFSESPFNRAVDARRQPGSAFKPIVYALAVEQGATQAQPLLDAPLVFKGRNYGRDWQPENFSRSYGGEMTLRSALAHSKNIPAVRLIEQVGPSSVAEFAHRLGIVSPLSPNLSLALGTSEVNPMELTSAYAVFANQGRRVQPMGVIEVGDRNGRVIWRAAARKEVVMSREAAAIVTDMLSAVIQEGTARPARQLGRSLAGKTGTSDRFRDAWFVGFSPSIAAGVWVGNDGSETLGKGETGARAALPIWGSFMQRALVDGPIHYFDLPDGTVAVRIDPASGRRFPDDSPIGVTALFLKGTEPKSGR